MNLTLLRPIAFIDIESTGTNKETDRIIELAICKLFVDGTRETKRFLINPQMPIPAASTAIHGLTDGDVADQAVFYEVAQEIAMTLEGCDIGGFNSNAFDVPLLFNEFRRVGLYWDYTKFKMVDAGNIFKIKEPRTLSAAVKFYCSGNHEEAHSAVADVEATVNVFLNQLQKYEDLPTTIDELAIFSNHGKQVLDLSGKFSYNDKGEIILNFGPKRGMPAMDNIDFIEWMYYKADFPPDTRTICEQLLFVKSDENEEVNDDYDNLWEDRF